MAKKKAAPPLLPGFPVDQLGNEARPLPPGIRVLLLPKLVRQAAESLRDVDREARDRAHEVFRRWIDGLTAGALAKLNETQVEQEFYKELMGALGYESVFSPAADQSWTMQPKWHIPGEGPVDAALGRFWPDEAGHVVGEPAVLVEVKGAGTDLDAKGSRKESPVQQLWRYMNATESARWGIVSNYTEIRLYSREKTSKHVHRVRLTDLGDRAAFAEFWAVFGRDGLLGAGEVEPIAARLLRETGQEQETVSEKLYADYAERRVELIRELLGRGVADLDAAIAAAQTLLDRVLFIAFAEDRALVRNRRLLEQTAGTRIPGMTPWRAFQFLFRAIDAGDEAMGIPGYNGSLFKHDPILDDPGLALPDAWPRAFQAIGGYDFRDEVSVDVLGRIFERSITDIEAIRDAGLDEHERSLAAERRRRSGQRKRHGVYYTDARITEYLVAAALDPQWDALKAEVSAALGIADDGPEPPAGVRAAQARALLERLDGLTACDPACGSGAFLIAAYDWFEEHRCEVLDALRDAEPDAPECRGDREEWKARSAGVILRRNLYGVDLSPESVEIARLSLWIRTARPGQPLTDLTDNVRVGNSVVDAPAVDPRAFDWRAEFPDVFERGGFDAVVGNPPYVRHHHIIPLKPHFETAYSSFHGLADLYVYFFEKGLLLLKDGGFLSFVVTNKWLKANYGEPLRRLYAKSAWVNSIVDFGHAKEFFVDADVFPCFSVIRKPLGQQRPTSVSVCAISRDSVDIQNLREQISRLSYDVPADRFAAGPWSLEASETSSLLEKIKASGQRLVDYAGVRPLIGIMSGRNEAYLIDSDAKDRLVAEDSSCKSIIKPYLRGQDLSRWNPEWANLWMIAMASSNDHKWPWADCEDEVAAEELLRSSYPSLHSHFKQWEPQLRNRFPQNIGKFWWEFRSCQYLSTFDSPKIIYQDITWRPSFCLDRQGVMVNSTIYFLPTDDIWVMAVLNSPAGWWYAFRIAQHGKDEALRYFTSFVEEFPIPNSEKVHLHEVINLVNMLAEIASENASRIHEILDWLSVQYGIESPSTRLKTPLGLTSDAFVAEVQKARGKGKPLTSAALKALREEYARTIEPSRGRAAEALRLEERLHDLVNDAYGLTPDEVRLMWDTAPPRMPIPRPASVPPSA